MKNRYAWKERGDEKEMFKLVRLEWKKNNIGKYVWYAFITSVLLLLMVLMVAGEMESKETIRSYGKSMLIPCVDMFTNLAYILDRKSTRLNSSHMA